jgi:hypothetical protein
MHIIPLLEPQPQDTFLNQVLTPTRETPEREDEYMHESAEKGT